MLAALVEQTMMSVLNSSLSSASASNKLAQTLRLGDLLVTNQGELQ